MRPTRNTVEPGVSAAGSAPATSAEPESRVDVVPLETVDRARMEISTDVGIRLQLGPGDCLAAAERVKLRCRVDAHRYRLSRELAGENRLDRPREHHVVLADSDDRHPGVLAAR